MLRQTQSSALSLYESQYSVDSSVHERKPSYGTSSLNQRLYFILSECGPTLHLNDIRGKYRDLYPEDHRPKDRINGSIRHDLSLNRDYLKKGNCHWRLSEESIARQRGEPTSRSRPKRTDREPKSQNNKEKSGPKPVERQKSSQPRDEAVPARRRGKSSTPMMSSPPVMADGQYVDRGLPRLAPAPTPEPGFLSVSAMPSFIDVGPAAGYFQPGQQSMEGLNAGWDVQGRSNGYAMQDTGAIVDGTQYHQALSGDQLSLAQGWVTYYDQVPLVVAAAEELPSHALPESDFGHYHPTGYQPQVPSSGEEDQVAPFAEQFNPDLF